MIHSFNCLDTEALFNSQVVARFRNIERVARRKLLQLHAATVLASLRVPPGNQLEALKGDRKGQHSKGGGFEATATTNSVSTKHHLYQ